MSKLVKLTGIDIGGDIDTVEIYHTSITASNLISSSVSASVLTGSGVSFVVDDNVTDFFCYVSGGLCLGTSGSITASVYSPSTRYLSFGISGSDIDTGSIEMVSPFTIGPTQTTFTASVNFNTYASATVEANAGTYPNDTFVGWYYSGSSTQLTSDSTLTLTNTTLTGSDDFVAYFLDI